LANTIRHDPTRSEFWKVRTYRSERKLLTHRPTHKVTERERERCLTSGPESKMKGENHVFEKNGAFDYK
jgi:hypothetical protein